MERSRSRFVKRSLAASVALGGLASAWLGAPSAAGAHFILDEPENWREQGTLGDPQKTGPCGEEGSAAMTGTVTAYRTGQTITISIRESIFHPGHFRVALATNDRSELPAPPEVTPGATACGTVPIMDPPVFPVLADGVLPHTAPLTGTQTFDVTLPDGVTCDHCTLQVIQFMSSHAAPCFYYHCADLSISDVVVEDAGTPAEDAATSGADAASPPVDAATSTTPDAASRADAGAGATSGGCACSAPGGGPGHGASGLAALSTAALAAWLFRRRAEGARAQLS